MNIKEYMKDNILVFDGAMGTMLQKKGLKLGEGSDLFTIYEREKVKETHMEYIEAGAKVICTNTFGANEIRLKGKGHSVEEVIDKAVDIAKEARGNSEVYIALDIGPMGEFLEPIGLVNENRAYEIFKRQVVQGVKSGVDLISIETIMDLKEAKIAVRAAKDNCNLPVFCTMSFDKDGKTFTGCLPEYMSIELEKLGADAIGVNCSEGPKELLAIIKKIRSVSKLPIIAQPNAGLPTISEGKAIYHVSSEEFTYWMNEFVKEGVSIIGGCCGTTPEYISKLKEIADNNKNMQ